MPKPTLPPDALREPLQPLHLISALGSIPPVIKENYVGSHFNDAICVWDITIKNWDVRLPVWRFCVPGLTVIDMYFADSRIIIETGTDAITLFVHELSWENSIPCTLNKVPQEISTCFQIHLERNQPISAAKHFIFAANFDRADLWDLRTGKKVLEVPIPHPEGNPALMPEIVRWPEVFMEGPYLIVVATDVHVFDLSAAPPDKKSRKKKKKGEGQK